MHETMRAVTLSGFGGLDVLRISEIPRAVISKGTDVLIKVKAAGVNKADLAQRLGNYPPPPGASETLGLEVSGVVAQVGEEVKNVKEGDKVMALLSGGGYAEYAVAHSGCVMPIPQGYSFIEAAAIPETFLTAWQALKLHANVQSGQHVLIHAGASGVGTAASQLVEKYFKATAVTTSSEAKVDICKRYASICLPRTADAEGLCFAPKVQAAVGPRRINAVIDPVFGGTYLNEDAAVLAEDGHIVVLAFMGGPELMVNGPALFASGATVIFSKLRSRSDAYKEALTRSFTEEALPLFASGAMKAAISGTYPLEKVAEAHAALAANKTWGKLILSMDAADAADAAGRQ